MSKRKIIRLLLVSFALLSISGWFFIYEQKKDLFEIAFLDVGQGDAILISQGSNQILIDTGPNSTKILEKLGQFMPFWDRRIEVVILSHADKDHIGGMGGILENYQVGAVIENGEEGKSQAFTYYQSLISQMSVRKIILDYLGKVKIGENILEVWRPEKDSESNGNSLMAKLNFNKDSFLFTGDMEEEEEKEFITKEINLEARVLKVSHHGSKYATSREFLEKVKPQEAVISVGRNNAYGHPSPDVIERLKERKVEILRTDESGDIIYFCKLEEDICLRSL